MLTKLAAFMAAIDQGARNIRQACIATPMNYKHGVRIARALEDMRMLRLEESGRELRIDLTETGEDFLTDIGVVLPRWRQYERAMEATKRVKA